MKSEYTHLFEPVSIRGVRLNNRICMPPAVMFGWSNEKGCATTKHAEHYQEIAQGGAGLIIQEATCVSPEGKLYPSQLGLWSDDQIDPLRRVVDAVHAQGVPIFVQLHHAGLLGVEKVNLSPVDFHVAFRDKGVEGKGMSLAEIERITDAFVAAARRAEQAGYDGIELHAAHGYLLSEFLNTRLNTRSDDYGKDPMRYLREVFLRVREAIDATMLLGARFACYEPTIENGINHATALVDLGADFLDVSRGFLDYYDDPTPEDWPYSSIVYGAKCIKDALVVKGGAYQNAPVFAVDRITSPTIAENILEHTAIDIVDIARGHLINPNWANDAREGREVGECLDCAECCFRLGKKERCPGRIKLAKKRKKEENAISDNAPL